MMYMWLARSSRMFAGLRSRWMIPCSWIATQGPTQSWRPQRHRLLRGEVAHGDDQVIEPLSLHVLHADVQQPVDLAEVVEPAHVRDG